MRGNFEGKKTWVLVDDVSKSNMFRDDIYIF
jgi:hypothetical protein